MELLRNTGEITQVAVVLLGRGIFSRYPASSAPEVTKELEKLKKQSETASKILGVQQNYYFNFPDNQFDTVPLLEIIKNIETVIAEVKPQKIYTHHPDDLNVDHQITYKAVLTATRPIGINCVGEMLTFEIPSSSGWILVILSKVFIRMFLKTFLGASKQNFKL